MVDGKRVTLCRVVERAERVAMGSAVACNGREGEGERWWCDVVKRKVRVLACARERGEVVKLKR